MLLTRCDGFQVIKRPLLLKLGRWIFDPPLLGPSWAGRHSCSARAAETRFIRELDSLQENRASFMLLYPIKSKRLYLFSSVGEQGFYYRHIGNHSAGISESGNYCFLRIPQTRLYIKPGCSAHISSPSLSDALGLHYLSLPSASHPAKCDSLAWRLHT